MKKYFSVLNAKVLRVIAASALIVAATSSAACWLVTFNQRKCPESLIQKD